MSKPTRRPTPEKDFGFYTSEDMAQELFDVLRNYHLLPRAGGWLDQREEERSDILTLMAEYNVITWELVEAERKKLNARKR